MEPFRVLSVAEQARNFLRAQILRGRWSGTMPGRHQLAAELGINHKTVETALSHLETEGLLERRGSGRRRSIKSLTGKSKPASLRIAILTGMAGDRSRDFMVEIRHRLIGAGHATFYVEPSLHDLRGDVRRIARLVNRTEVDAWIVVAGSSEVLKWFAARSVPVFALFGRLGNLRIAGGKPDKSTALVEVTRELLALGHRRVVLMTHASRRLPMLGRSERAFVGEIEAAGILPGSYHLPDWTPGEGGFRERLDSLFQLTPPSALILDTVPMFAAAQQFVAMRGLRVPEDVSLVCCDEPKELIWQNPAPSHIRWDRRPMVRSVVTWATNVSLGRPDFKQTLAASNFVRGGTIGPLDRP